jgi:predicted NAD-dependent protein-ADP-ribosyltransferase YbiA (DUF1768 family)
MNNPTNTPTPNVNAQSNTFPPGTLFPGVRTFVKPKPVQFGPVVIQPTVPHRLWTSPQPESPTDIGFITTKEPHGWLHCMSAYPLFWAGNRYPTAEHLFQCLRFSLYPQIQDEILAKPSPMAAKWVACKHKALLGRRPRYWDESPDDIDRMRFVLRLKLDQHPALAVKLKATGQAVLVEDCSRRDRGSARFWGAVKSGGKWCGANVLGCLWMELRDTLP